MNLNKFRNLSLICFWFILVIDSFVYANAAEVLVDPMAPKTVETQKDKNTTTGGDKPRREKILNLSAVGYNDHQMYCIINGAILCVNDTIDSYVVKEIGENEVTLVNDEDKERKLILD